MSLHPSPMGAVPEETAHVARAAFPKGNVYLQMRDLLGVIYDDAQFADLFAPRGRPVEAPWRLALVTVMQFAEGLSDRQAAEAVRGRIDWKYALGLELSDPGFDSSVLCEFRARLVSGSAEHRLLDALLEACKQQGYLKARGRQRTDSTHILGALRVLSRIERAAETLRAALNALAGEAPDWLRGWVPADWYERYGRRIEESRLPKGQEARVAYLVQVGADGQQLLHAMEAPATPEAYRHLPAIRLLREVWAQQFTPDPQGPLQVRHPKAMPVASDLIESPYEVEARYATKREVHWVGYKVHLSETCDEDAPHLITQVQTTIAPATDQEQLALIQEDLATRALLPAEQLVDAGYVRAHNLVTSRAQHGIDLVGPINDDYAWQAKQPDGFDLTHFQIDWEHRRAWCPCGHASIRWCQTTSVVRKRPMIHVDFDPADCHPCPARARCTRMTSGPGARSLTLQVRADHEAVQAARERQQTEEFAARYARRAGIEGTISQGVRAFGLRRARYRGRAKTHLQGVAIAAAIHLARIDNWCHEVPLAATRCSRFARLAIA